MTILSYKLGPGQLELGSGPLEVNAQCTKCKLVPEETVTAVAAIDVLSGEQIPEEEDAAYSYKLEATFLQDTLLAGGLVGYTWAHVGETVPFRFVPNDALDRQVSGNLRIIPLAIGGDVKIRNTSDWSVRIIGTPVLADTP